MLKLNYLGYMIQEFDNDTYLNEWWFIRENNLYLKAKQTLENTERAIENGQSREPGNIGYTRRRQTKQKYNTICGGHH
jgi:hypothetical protein